MRYEYSGVIVNSNFELQGCVIVDKSTGQRITGSLRELVTRGFMRAGQELTGVPVYQMSPNGKMVLLTGNNIEITARIVDVDGPAAKTIGYYVNCCGIETPMKTEQIIRISGWIYQRNFMVRTDISKNGQKQRYLVSKRGFVNLQELPTYVGGNSRGPKADAKAGKFVQNGGKAPAKKVNAAVGGSSIVKLDIETLISKVEEVGGLIAMAPGKKYQATGSSGGHGRFVAINEAEIAFPKLAYNETKMNANAKFRRRGEVRLPNDGPITVVPAFMWREKHLFYNGRNQMETLRLLIPADRASEIERLGSKDFAVRRVGAEEATTKGNKASYAGDPYNTENMVEFEVRMEKLSIIGFPHPGNESILDARTLFQKVYTMTYMKTMMKVLRAKKKALLADTPELKNAGRSVAEQYQGLSTEQLEFIQQYGVDIFTGAYNPIKADLEEEESGASKGGAPAVEIEYRLSGWKDGDLSGDGKYKVDMKELKHIQSWLEEATKYIEGTSDQAVQFERTTEYMKKVEEQVDTIKHELWRHKCAMLVKGSGKIHQHDKDLWDAKPSKKANSVIYQCNVPELAGLAMTVTGTMI